MRAPCPPSRRVPGFALLANGEAYGHESALSLAAGDVERGPDEMGPFAHAEQAEGVRGGLLALRDPSSIVLDAQEEFARALLQRDRDLRRLRMTKDIRQGLLKDAEHGGRLLVV